MSHKSDLHKALDTMTRLGIDVEYGPLTLCNLGHFSITRNILERKFQVDCDSAEIRFTQMYNNYYTAIDKFISLYAALKSKEMQLELKEKKN